MAVLFQRAALERARVAKGLSRSALADASGVALRTIHNLETGVVASPNPGTVKLLADALGVEVMDLYETAEVA